MIKLYKLIRSKRAVSPVIAVVLLIALTVAAVAVIWAIVTGFFGSTNANITYTNINYDNSTTTFTVNLESSSDATVTGAEIVGNPANTVTITNSDATLTANSQKAFTFTFAEGLPAGSYQLSISVSVDGNNQLVNVPFNV